MSAGTTIDHVSTVDINATIPPSANSTQPIRDAWQTIAPALIDANATVAPSSTPSEGSSLQPAVKSLGGSTFPNSRNVPLADEPSVSGVTISGYEIRRVLGRGSMGVVYKAKQLSLNRTVALKMVIAGGHASIDERARFQREAEALASLQHPNIIQVYEVGEADGMPFFSMEFLPGGTLEQLTEGGSPIAPKLAAEIVEKLARAMSFAHSHGIIHRDLKPANVLMSAEKEPKITDFGLAKRLDEAAGLGSATQTGTAMGTPSYMAPEQAEGRVKEIGPLADVYALGAILYELVTGRPPFKGVTAVDTMLMVVSEEPVSPTRLQPRLPRDIATICLKCIQKPLPKRYQSALELAEDLRRFQNGEPIKAVPIGNWERVWKWAKRRPATAGLLLFTAIASITTVTLGISFHLELRAAMRETQIEKKVAVSRLARLYVAQGMTYSDRGDNPLALPYLIEAIKLDKEDPSRDELNRIRLAAVLKYCPRLVRVGFHESGVCDVGFSPTGNYAFSASSDGCVHIWLGSTTDPAAVHVSHVMHGAAINRGAFSRDGLRFATAGVDGKARMWDSATAKQIHIFEHGAEIRVVAFDPTGKILLTGGADGRIVLWNIETGKPVLPAIQHGKGVNWAAFSGDGECIVSAGTLDARLWSTRTGQQIGTPFHTGTDPVLYVEFSPGGKHLVTAGGDNFARQWVVTPGGAKPFGRDMHHTEDVLAAHYNPAGTRIATASADGTARVWDLEGKSIGQMMWHNAVVTDAQFSPDGLAVLTSSDDNTARVWDSTTGLPKGPRLAHSGAVSRAVFSPNNTYVLTGSQSGVARVYRRLDAYPTIAITLPPPIVRKPVRSRDGKWEAVWGPNNTLRILDAVTRQAVGPDIQLKGNVFTADFSPDGTRIVTANDAASAVIWNIATAEPVTPQLRHASAVYSASFNSDGTQVVTGSDDNTARVWDANTGDTYGQPMRHDASVNKAVFHPAGNIVLTSCSDGSARAWDPVTGEPLTPPLDQNGWVRNAFNTPWNEKTWDLPVERRPLKELALEAHWLSGHTVDKAGVIVSSDVATIRQLWETILKEHPSILSP